MKLLVIDNYDSFVYNLVHMIYNLGIEDITVLKNDKFQLDDVEFFDKILLSPGPGVPKDAGLMPEVIKKFGSSKPILGVCLGHQAIAESYGCELKNLKEPLHGISSKINFLKEDYLFENTPNEFNIGHYHSWVVNENTISKDIKILAKDENGNIMSIAHEHYDIRGVQFHPESVLTENGKQLISNWIKH
ncbi:MAG: anthranilate synthase component II [Saprospiraceae bacterium]